MTDDDLRARLRRADPAADLPPPAPDRVSRLLENTMTTPATAPHRSAPPRSAPGRSASGRSASGRFASGRFASGRFASGRSASGRFASGRSASGRSASGRSASGRFAPLRPAPRRFARRGPAPLIATAAAALVLIAALGTWFLLRPDNDPGAPVAAPTVTTSTSDASTSGAPTSGAPTAGGPTVTDITASGVAAKCVEPSADRLREAADFAFAGTVTAVDGKAVTLKVTKVYRGTPTDEVRVAQTGDISETLMGSGKFEAGRDYLVASAEGAMLICGYSGEAASPGLAELYVAAF
ncbi:hypothetical protein [Actinoplanes sp. M2I2]|uniref:hypothetical protein n=1 Tax=Actinoplanes sp. M2I2 TaxID=1734444 RepID=UPI00202105C8|nr:hypothetical protein [Actinoplanes sp. M2I2]